MANIDKLVDIKNIFPPAKPYGTMSSDGHASLEVKKGVAFVNIFIIATYTLPSLKKFAKWAAVADRYGFRNSFSSAMQSSIAEVNLNRQLGIMPALDRGGIMREDKATLSQFQRAVSMSKTRKQDFVYVEVERQAEPIAKLIYNKGRARTTFNISVREIALTAVKIAERNGVVVRGNLAGLNSLRPMRVWMGNPEKKSIKAMIPPSDIGAVTVSRKLLTQPFASQGDMMGGVRAMARYTAQTSIRAETLDKMKAVVVWARAHGLKIVKGL